MIFVAILLQVFLKLYLSKKEEISASFFEKIILRL